MRRVAGARWMNARGELKWAGSGTVPFSQVLESGAESWTARRVAGQRRRWAEEVVAASEFGVSEDEGRTQGERDQKNQDDGCEGRDWRPTPALREAVVCLGRCRQAWRNPCLRAQCFVRSIQPLFSFFQRLWPNWRMIRVGKRGLLGAEW